MLEQGWGFRYEGFKLVKYDRIDMLKPEKHTLLLEDLRRRTGLPLTRFEIGRINLVDDTVNLYVYFDQPRKRHRVRDSHLSSDVGSYLAADDD